MSSAFTDAEFTKKAIEGLMREAESQRAEIAKLKGEIATLNAKVAQLETIEPRIDQMVTNLEKWLKRL